MEYLPLKWEGEVVEVLDQRLLPTRVKYVKLEALEDFARAIRDMVVRGAPLIGITGALGLSLYSRKIVGKPRVEFVRLMERAASFLISQRPTAVNLEVCTKRVLSAALAPGLSTNAASEEALSAVESIIREEEASSRKIGEYGSVIIEDGSTVLTHCNAGALATVGYGTALAPIRIARERGRRVRVYATETRPAMQGARLTTFELLRENFDVTLIADTAVGLVIQRGLVNLVIVGADRITRDGTIFNKIGTYQIALLASHHGIPFYVAAPTSTLDLETDPDQVVIEERSPLEVTHVRGKRVAPRGVKVFNPVFDRTPPKYVTAIITDRGLIYSPLAENIEKTFRGG